MESLGYVEFTVGVIASNKTAMYIYQKFGFTETINIGFDNYLKEMYTLYLRKNK